MRYAVINLETNIVENHIIWDGHQSLFPYTHGELIQILENELCDMGYAFDAEGDPRFSAP